MEMLFSSLFCDSASSENFSGHPDVERCPFLRNINGATTFSFSSALPVAARGGKGPIFEDGPGFESAFKLFHGQDGIVPLSGRSYVHDENRIETTNVKPEPALPFNPLAARAATISLSGFGPFGFNFFNGKGKKQNKKPNNLDQSHKKPSKPDQNSMKQKGGNPPSHESLSDEWLENGQCPLARSYRAMSGVLPLVAKALQPPAGMKLKCPPAIVAARAALARTTLVKSLRPQPLPSKMVAIALLGMAANVPLGVWREHTKKFSPQWFAAVHAVSILVHPHLLRVSSLIPRPTPGTSSSSTTVIGELMADNTRSDRKPSLLGGDDRPADTADEAMFLDLEVPHEADLSWVERGLLSALGVPLEQTPPTDPAGGELAVGSTGDLYYIPSGTPEKLDDSLGDQLWSRMGWDEQDSVVNVEKKQDSDDDTPL